MRYAREYPRAHLLVPRPTRRLRARLHVQVLVAGSLAVMSVMGVPVSDTQWKDLDVDIFCTWDAAPVVRQRLIERCGLICSWVDNSYRQEGPDLSTKLGAPDFVQTCLSHVESYNSRRMEGRYGDEYDDDSKRLEYTSDAYFARACQWGAEAVASHPKRLGTPKGSAGVSFPYDYELRRNSFVQLIVGHPSLKDARALLTKFDLEICKFSFDGTTFRAPNAVKSFAGRTSVTPARHARAPRPRHRLHQERHEARPRCPVRWPQRNENGYGSWKGNRQVLERHRRHEVQNERRLDDDVQELVRFSSQVRVPHQARGEDAEVRETGGGNFTAA